MKSQNQNIFEKFKLNQNLQRIPFKMIYNMSVTSLVLNELGWGGGGGGGLPRTTFLSYSVKVCNFVLICSLCLQLLEKVKSTLKSKSVPNQHRFQACSSI